MTTETADHGNIAAHLPEIARSQPDALAVAVAVGSGFRRISCSELDAMCDRTARALRAAGIGTGMRTVLMVTPSPEFFALTFALFKIGAVPVMVDPGMGLRNLGRCLAEAAPTAFVGIPKAHAARRILGWAKPTIEIQITVGRRWLGGGHSLKKLLQAVADRGPYPIDEPQPDQTAAILFTSGSTGPPKGVVYTHETFGAQVESLRAVYGIERGEVDLSTFPLFALFGPALGMASVVPRMDASRPATADPRDLVRAISEFACTNVFANPALIDRLGRHCAATNTRLSSVRRVLSAGAPASPAALERLVPFLPDGVEIFTPYGATESLPVSSIGSSEILGETRALTEAGKGVCVGHPVPGVEAAIIPITADPIESWTATLALAPGTIGEIVVRGPVVTESYFARPAATRHAKIPDRKAVWHRMGDAGYLDGTGRLWMCGRVTHRVCTEHGTMFTVPCEAIFNTHPAVRRSALVGVPHEDHTVPVICIELEPSRGWFRHRSAATSREQVTAELLELARTAEHTREIQTVLFHPKFPVDVRHNAKIFRERLAVWAARKLRNRVGR